MCGNAHGVKGTPQGVVGAWGEQCASTEPTHLLRAAAGDLAKINLGLKPEAYKRVAAEVDTIVHNGALVNHAFSYRQLFEPNVLGTVEIMKLAIATRVKALTFISSVGVAGGLDHPAPVTEEEVGTALCTEHPGDGGYALGCVAAAPRRPLAPLRGFGLGGGCGEPAGAGRRGAVMGSARAWRQWPSSPAGLHDMAATGQAGSLALHAWQHSNCPGAVRARPRG